MSATTYKAFNTNCLSNSIVEGVSKSSFQCGRECIKIMKDAKKGCVAAQPCLTPGEAQPNPVQAYLTHTKRPRRGRTYLCTGSYSPTYGDGIAMILSTPGSAPLRSPRPALSIIGQLRSPSLYFDTLSIWLDKLLILNVLYVVPTSRRGTPRLYSWQNRILIHPLHHTMAFCGHSSHFLFAGLNCLS